MSEITSVKRRQDNIRVLIVDDSSSFRRELRNYLESERGITVVGEAENGLQAVEMTESKKPDVVLMDQSMPKLSGVGATSRIKAGWPGTRVIFVAAEGQSQQDAMRAGAERYFLKEDDLLELTEAIKDPLAGLRPVVTAEPKPEIGRFLGDKWLWRGVSALLGVSYVAALVTSPQITLLWTSLICGVLFFIYGLKYYLSVALVLFATSGNGNNHNGITQSRKLNGLFKNGLFNGKAKERGDGKGNGRGLNGLRLANGGNGRFPRHLQPFISIHLPLYNETAVVDRLLTACTSLDYENYEVIVADDSTDETSQILKERWESHPRVKLSHRIDRSGFKGGALRVAMGRTDPRTEFIVVFDADFVPQPDILHQFLAYFYGTNGANGHHRPIPQDATKLDLVDERVAVVQGYQWHMLNASENWITRGIRSEYSGSYVVERSCQEFLGSMKMISGSVFMIRADVLKKVGWRTSITEDWELTLRLYLEGYRVLYTPFIQAPAECVASFRDLSRQRMRWAEGHTFNVKKYFLRVLQTPNISRREKLEFIYFAPYYLQSAFFLLGTGAWLTTDLLLNVDLPFWTAALGWSLVFANGFSLILMNLAGLFLERGIRRNWAGLLSFILLTYLLVPYQAYAALKGLFEPHEGGWHRTTKTGVITEIVERLGLRRHLRRILPKQRKRSHAFASHLVGFKERLIESLPSPFRRLLSPGALRFRLASGLAISILLLAILAARILVVSAAPDSFYLRDTATTGASPAGKDMNSVQGSSEDTLVFNGAEDEATWYTDITYPTGGDDATILGGDYKLQMYFDQLPSDWWNTAYLYRHQIQVTATTAAVDAGYSVSFTFNHGLLTPAKSLDTGDDVRVVHWNGSGWTELDRVLDPLSSWDSASTQIWFALVDPIGVSSSDNNYYMYYGNSSASNPPDDWANVFMIGDDFDDGSLTGDVATSTAGTADINEVGGEAFIDLGTDETTDAGIIVTKSQLPNDKQFAIRHKTKLVNGGGGSNPEVKTIGIQESAGQAAVDNGVLENPRRRIIAFHRCEEAGDPLHDREVLLFYFNTAGTQVNWNGTNWVTTSAFWSIEPLDTYYIYDLVSNGTSWFLRVSNADGTERTTTSAVNWSDVKSNDPADPLWFYWGEIYKDFYYADQKSDWVYVRDYVNPEPTAMLVGTETDAPFVSISVSVYKTKGDGSDPQQIVAASDFKIDANTPDPYDLLIGNGAEQTFTSTDPRRLRVHVDVTQVNGGGSFTLAYDSSASPSSLTTPAMTVYDFTLLLIAVVILIPFVTGLATRKRRLTVRLISLGISILIALAVLAQQVYQVTAAPDVFYLRGTNNNGASPAGQDLTLIQGSSQDTLLFDDTLDEAYWYTELTYPVGGEDASIAAGMYSLNMHFDQLPQVPSDWYGADWPYRKKLTIDASKVMANFLAFPVLVSLDGDTDLAAKAQADGGDILFTSSDGLTKLDHEIELFETAPGSEKIVAWVEVQNLSSVSDTDIYMYYGNDTVADQWNINGTWDANHKGVWHLAEDPGPGGSGDILDSTLNNKHGTAEATMTFEDLVPGQIGNGIDFDGGNDYLWMPDPLDGDNITFSAWIYPTDIANDFYTVAWRDSLSGSSSDWHMYARAADAPEEYSAIFRVDADDTGTYPPDAEAESGIELSINTWYYIAGTYDGTEIIFYLDGQWQGTEEYPGIIPDSDNNLLIAMNGPYGEPFQGIIDEVRVSNTARTYEWIQTSYNNQYIPSQFYKSIGSEETLPEVDIVVSVYHTNTGGSDPQEIITSSTATIDTNTANPYVLDIGSGAEQDFATSDPRRVRIHIDVTAIRNGGSFTLAYDSAAKPSSLSMPSLIVFDMTIFLLAVVILIPSVTGLATRKRRLAVRIISVSISIIVALAILAQQVFLVNAAPDVFYLHDVSTGSGTVTHTETQSAPPQTTATSYDLPTVAGGTNQLYLVAVAIYRDSGDSYTISSITGGGLTWSLQVAQCSARINNPRIEIWQAYGSTSSFAATVNLSGPPARSSASISSYFGADPITPTEGAAGSNYDPGNACLGPYSTTDDTDSTSLSLTSSRDNSVLFVATQPRIRTITVPDADYTERAYVNNVNGGDGANLYVHDRTLASASTDSADHTLSGVADWDMAGLVINPASGVNPAGKTMNVTLGSGGSTLAFDTPGQNAYWYTDITYPTGDENASIAAGDYTLNMHFSQLPTAWYDSDWSYRKQLTLDSGMVVTDLSNFPVLVSLTDTGLRDYAQADGGDILFTNASGTKLDHEIERYVSGTGELVAWVEVTDLSGSIDTDVYMYYGNATVADQWNVAGTWDSNYIGVWHLDESGDGTSDEYQDSSQYLNHGQGGKGDSLFVPAQVGGKIGYGQDFNIVYAVGDASIELDSNIVTFGSAYIPLDIQAGDFLTIDPDDANEESFIVASRDSETQVTVTTNATIAHTAETYILYNRDIKYDLIDVGNDDILDAIGDEITLEAWVQHNASMPPAHQVYGVLNHKGWSAGYSLWMYNDQWQCPSGEPMCVTFNLPGETHSLSTETVLSGGTWHHVVATYDGSLPSGNMRIFIDGVEDTNTVDKTGDITAPSPPEDDVWVGHGDQPKDAGWSGEWVGQLDEVRISNAARPIEWVQTEYNNQENQGTGAGKFIKTLGSQESVPSVEIQVSVYNTAADGSDAQEIITSSAVTIDSNTPNPYALNIGSGGAQTYTSSDPRRLRVLIDITAVNGGGSFTLAYDSAANDSSLDTPSMVIPDLTLLLVAVVILIPVVMNLFMKKRRLAIRLASIAISLVVVLGILGQNVLPVTAAPDVFYLHDTDAGSAWYSVDWSYRKKITINASQVSADLNYFPVLINQSSDAQLAASAQSDGGDILFTSANGTTKLDHEIEKYVSGNGELVAWVEVPSLSGSVNTVLYMYYGNATVGDQWNINGTWDADYSAVWHLSENPTDPDPAFKDSTLNNNHATDTGSMASEDQQPGQVDGSLDFDGDNDYIEADDSSSLRIPGSFTVSAWINTNDLPADGDLRSVVSKGNPSDNPTENHNYGIMLENNIITTGHAIEVYYEPSGGFTQVVAASWETSLNTGQWYYVVGVHDADADTLTLYVDTVQCAQNTEATATPDTGDTPMRIADVNVSWATNEFYGQIDEVRISKDVRSEGWIVTEYNNQKNPSSFYSIDSQETPGITPAGKYMNLTPGSGGSTLVFDSTDDEAYWYTELTYPTGDDDATLDAGAYSLDMHFDQLPAGGANWYNTDWAYRKKITIDNAQVSGTSDLDYFPVLVSFSQPTLTVSRYVVASTDDAEQAVVGGGMSLTSSDLELVVDSSTDQEVGMRFANLTIPKGATIKSAYLQFAVDAADSGATSVTLYGEYIGDALTFSSTDNDITDRTKTSASVDWNNIPAWSTAGEKGPDQRAPDLSSIIQEIVNHADWASGNALVIIADGTGERTAESYNGAVNDHADPTLAPRLTVEYVTGSDTRDTDLRDTSNGGYVEQADGGDILFTDSNGTKLHHEIEKYDNTTGELVAWVEVPTLSHNTDTDLYIYYGNSINGSNQWNITGTWDEGGADNYKGVWHLDEDAEGTGTADLYQDSTSHANHADDSVSFLGQGGHINGGQEFDGVDDKATVSDPGGAWDFSDGGLDAGTSDFTISAWVSLSSLNTESFPSILAKGGGSTTSHGYWFNYQTSPDSIDIRVSDGTNRFIATSDASGLTRDDWEYVTVVFDREPGTDTAYFYLNGSSVGSDSSSLIAGNSATGTQDFEISGQRHWNGSIDEVRIADTTRTSDWIATEFNNQSAPSSFYNVYSQETPQSVDITVSVYHTDDSGGDPQEIVTSSTITIDASTSNPYTLPIGSGSQQTFTPADNRRLRVHVDVVAVDGGGSFTLAYDSAANDSSLDTPSMVVPDVTLLLIAAVILIPVVTALLTRKRRLAIRLVTMGFSLVGVLAILGQQILPVTAAPDVFYLHDTDSQTGTINIQVAASTDDAEESLSNGAVDLTSSDLELIREGSSNTQEVGLRFTGITVPQGAKITNAYIEFEADEADTETTNLSFWGQDSDDTVTFTDTPSPSFDISARPKTTASVAWNEVPEWVVNVRYQTPDLSPIIQEIVDRTGWTSGNSMVVIVTGSGQRIADSYNKSGAYPALLHIEYSAVYPDGKYMNITPGSAGSTMLFDSLDDEAYWYTDITYPTGEDDASIAAGPYTLDMHFDQLPQVPADWYSANWPYRKKITIDSGLVTANILNFPVLISLTSDSGLANDAQDDGDDILFTSSNGTTKLSHEIETFNDSSGKLMAWVKVNLSSSTDTELYMYYGNGSVASQEDVANVWSNGYIGVWHLDETGSTVSDSTSPSYDGTVSGASPNSSAYINGGFDFVRAEDDEIEMFGTANALSLTDFTVEAWMITLDSSVPDDYYAVTQSLYCDNNEAWALNIADDTGYEDQVRFTTMESGTQTRVFGPVITDSQWHYVAGVRTSTQLLMYVDDGAPSSVADGRPGETILSSANIAVGAAICNETEDFNGTIDEVRISDSARNEDWIDTTYNNHANQGVGVGKFIESLGSEETLPSVEITVSVYHTNLNGGDPQEIVTSSTITIDANTSDPYELPIGSGSEQTFNSTDPRRVRVLIDVTAVNGGGSFTLAYDSAANDSSLDTPSMVVPDLTLFLAAVVILIPIVMNLLMRKRRLAIRLASFAISLVVVLGILGQNVFWVTAAPDVFYLHDTDASGAWYDVDWSYRKKITIHAAQVSADLSYFPVLINQNSDDELAASAQADGGDILFTSADGITKLDHEIELYLPGTGKLVAWVEVPDLSGSVETILYMYYGNATVADQWNVAGTWDENGSNNFKAVWHLDDLTTSTVEDSAASNDGTKGAANLPLEIDAKIGKGQDFTPLPDYIELGTTGFSASSGTIEVWGKAEAFSGVEANYLFGHTTQPAYADRIQLYTDDTNGNLDLGLGDAHLRHANIQDLDLDTWYHFAVTWDGTNYVVYVDGSPKANGSYTGLSSIYTFIDGGNNGQPTARDEAWNGVLDEMRVSNIPRTSSWIATEVNNQSSPATFYDLGLQESQSISPAGKEMNITLGSGAATQLFDGVDDEAYWYTELTYPTGDDDASIAAGDYTLNTHFDQLPKPWWDSQFPYRQQITVTAGSADVPANYSVWFDFNHQTLVNANKSLNSGMDVRIVYWNGSGWTELDRLRDDLYPWGQPTTRVWFQTQAAISANTSDTNYYMYYGDLTSTAPPQDWSNVFLFYDNFNDGSFDTGLWSCGGSGASCTESGGSLTLGADTWIFANSSYAFGLNTRWEARLRLSHAYGLHYNYWGASDSGGYEGDYIAYWADDSQHYAEQNDSTTVISPSTPTSYHRYFFDREGTGVRYTQDTSELAWKTSNIPADNLRVLAWVDASDRTQTLDYVRVMSYVNPEPTTSVDDEASSADVRIVVSVYHTNDSGGDSQQIVTSSTITIDANTSDPYELPIGSGSEQTFTSSDPRRLRVHIDVTAVNGGESFTLAYDSAANDSSLDTPSMVVPDVTLLLIAAVILIPLAAALFTRKQRLAIRLASIAISFMVVLGILGQTVLLVGAAPDVFYLHDTAAGSSWYNTDWSYRKKITIYASQVSADLEYFPVLINQSSDAQLAASAQADGGDILFTSADGTTKLDHEIEKFTPGTGGLVAWVEVPSLSGSVNTVLYMYYGNGTVEDQWNINGTWNENGNNNYKAVWHLAETSGGSGAISDSTLNNNHGTDSGTPTLAAGGQIGNAIDFDGGDDYVSASDSTSLDISGTGLTLSAWIAPDFTQTDPKHYVVVDKRGNSNANAYKIFFQGNDPIDDWRFLLTTTIGGISACDTQGLTWLANEWHYLVATYDGGNMRMYWDGSPDHSVGKSGNITTTDFSLRIGYLEGGSPDTYFDGTIDEVRISDIHRSAEWIATEYANQSTPSSFYGLDDQETPGITPAGKYMNITTGSAGSTMLFDSTDDGAYWYTELTYPTGDEDANIAAGMYSLDMYFDQLPQVPSDWYSTDWLYRKKLTIDASKVMSNFLAFPVLVSLDGDTDLAAEAQADGGDILFTSSNGLNKLDHEIELFESGTGKLAAWVEVQNLSSVSDTDIYMYYGNDTVADQWNINGTWDNNYKGVWHLAEDPGPGGLGDITDSTSNNKHGTAEASMTNQDLVPGQIGNGIDFDGGNDYLWMPDPLDGSNMTFSAWIKATDLSNSWHTLAQRDDDGEYWYDWQFYVRANDAPTTNGAVFRVDVDDSENINEQAGSNIVLSTNTWYYLAGTYNGTDLKFYRDGQLRNTDTEPGTIPDSDKDLWIAMNEIWGEPFQGIIDEVRISNTARTEEWIQTSYNNQYIPSQFYKSIGTEETLPEMDIIVSVYHTDASGGDAQEIITSSIVTIDTSTTDPYTLEIGSGAEQTFTSSDPRRVRVYIDVTAVRNGGSFTLAYDSAADTSSLDTPVMVISEWNVVFVFLVVLTPYLAALIWRRRRLAMGLILLLGVFVSQLSVRATQVEAFVDEPEEIRFQSYTTPLMEDPGDPKGPTDSHSADGADYRERSDLRGRNSKISQLFVNGQPTDKFLWEGSLAPLHYQDAQGEWQEIRSELVPSSRNITGFGAAAWEMTENEYEIFLHGEVKNGEPYLRFKPKRGGYWVQFTPQELQWTAMNGHSEVIAPLSSVQPVVAEDELVWPGAYGEGVDLRLEVGAGRIHKWLDLAKPLSAPSDSIMQGGYPILEYIESISYHPGLSIWVNGQEWDEEGVVITAGEIQFRDPQGGLAFTFPLPSVTDAGGKGVVGQYRLTRQGNSLILAVGVPLAWLDDATYPISIDPTIDPQVGASTDDCDRWGDTDLHTEYSSVYLDHTDENQSDGMRFINVAVPNGATIDTAYLTLRARNSPGDITGGTTIKGQDHNDPPTFTQDDYAEYDARMRTTASVYWQPSAWVENSDYNSPEIKTIVQEIVDRSGWSSGNAMVLFFEADMVQDIQAFSYDGNSTYAPKLHIEYSPSQSLVYKVDASSDDCDRDNINWTTTTQTFYLDWDSVGQADGVRFTTVTVPKAATITSANLRVRAWDTASVISGTTIYGQAADDPLTFSSASDFNLRTWTTANVYWLPSVWVGGTYYDSPDISEVVQEIVDRSGWASGNAMAFKLDGDEDQHVYGYSYDYEYGQYAPELHIEYAMYDSVSVQVSASTDDVDHDSKTWDLTTDYFYLDWDNPARHSQSDGLRFASVAVPDGATIVQAYFTVRARDDQTSGIGGATIYGQDADNPLTFSTREEYEARTWISSPSVHWEPQTWIAELEYYSPDVSSIIQAIIDRPGWASGQAMAFMFDGDEEDNVDGYSWDYNSGQYAPQLYIEYTLPPAAPSNCQATYISDTQIDVTWTDDSYNETGFKIESSVDGGGFSQIDTAGEDEESYSDTSTSADHSYQYRVRAYNANADSSYCTATATIYTSPDPPTNVTATHTADLEITLTWTDQSQFEDQFRIERDKNNGGYVFLADDTDGSPYVDSTITQAEFDNKDSFTYRIRSEISSQSRVSVWVYSNTVVVPEQSILLVLLVPLLPLAIRKWSGRSKISSRVLFKGKKKLLRAARKPALSEGEIADRGVKVRATKETSSKQSMKQRED